MIAPEATPHVLDLTNNNIETVLDTVPATVLLVGADGKIGYVNKYGREFYALPSAGPGLPEVDMAAMGFFYPDGARALFDDLPVIRTLQCGESSYHTELLFENADGKSFPVLFTSVPLHDEQGNIKGAVITMEDMSERERMAAILRASVEKYRPLITVANEGVIVVDADGKIFFANEIMAERLGFEMKNMPGRSIFDFIQKEDLETFILHYYHRKTGVSERYRLKMKDKNGDTVWVWINSTPLHDQQGHFAGILAMVLDITDRTETEKKFALQSSVLSDICEAIVVADASKRLVYGNRMAQTITGWPSQAMAGLTVEDLFAKLSIDVPDAEITAELQTKGYAARELSVCCHDGVRLHVHLHCQKIDNPEDGDQWMLVSLRDITAQNETLLISEAENRQLSEILDSFAVGSFVHDLLTDEVYYSSEWKKRLGIEALLPKQVTMQATTYVHPDDAETVLKTYFRAIKQKVDKVKMEFRIKTVDMGYIWVLTQVKIIYDQEKQPIKCFGTLTDITSCKQAEGALLASKKTALDLVAKLREIDRNKNQFLATLSHELRNPLAVIVMGVALFQHAPFDEQKAKQLIETINRQAMQLSHLVDDLLEVTRVTQNKIVLKKEPIILNDLVAGSVKDYQLRFAGKGVRLVTQFLTGPIHLAADPIRLVQVLGNLLHNAHHVTKDGEETFVIVDQDEHKQEAVIMVRDTGAGIAPELLPNLFEPFVQGNNAQEQGHVGLGLGLAVTKGLVELHGGNIAVESDGPGKGAQFTIRLPITQIPGNETEEPLADEKAPARLWRILMIEDNQALSEIVCQLLEFLGYQAIAAASGWEGLTKAKEYQPEVILCDLGLPDIDGYAIAERIRQDAELKDIFLVAMSGYAQPADVALTKVAGFNCHLAKPVDLNSLKKVLDGIPNKQN